MVCVLIVPSLLGGLLISIFQAATQINEQMLSFLPRLLITLGMLVFAGHWILRTLSDLFIETFQQAGRRSAESCPTIPSCTPATTCNRCSPTGGRSAGSWPCSVWRRCSVTRRSACVCASSALALTLVLGAALPTPPTLDPLSLAGMLATIEQIAMGLLLGLALLLVFTVFTLIGDVVSTQLGLSMAVFNDPMNGVSSASIIYQLYFILLALLFFAVDGHLVTVSIIYQSFVYWPIGSGLFYDGLQTIARSMAWVISAALLIALPIVFCMTLVQFCFGLLNRISAMNLFSLGFPMAILAGLSLIYLTLPNWPRPTCTSATCWTRSAFCSGAAAHV